MFNKKTILITGGTGSFGKTFVKFLINNYKSLGRCFRQICDQVLAFLFLFKTGKDHFGTRNVFFGCFQVIEQSVFSPHDGSLFVGLGIGKTFDFTRNTAKKTVQIRSLFVGTTGFHSVAL